MIHYIIIILLSAWGILLCRKIYKEKQINKSLVCTFGADCETIVRGQFSSFLGVGLEVYGGFYYLLILISYIAFYSLDFGFEPILKLSIVVISGLAFFMSLALTFIQAFVIKTWCSWCLISAGISTGIFILGLILII